MLQNLQTTTIPQPQQRQPRRCPMPQAEIHSLQKVDLLSKLSLHLFNEYSFSDPPKKRGSNFLCSIICCLGKRSSKHKNKDKEVSANNANSGDVIDGSTGSNAKPSSKGTTASQRALLPDLRPDEADKKCIVIDLDETLVHSSFKVFW